MKMTIDKTIEFFNGLECHTPQAKDARDVAISTMCKYQEIEKIINAPIGGTSAKYNAIVNLIKYSEVDNGKDSRN